MPKSINWDEALSSRLVRLWPKHSAAEIVAIFDANGYSLTKNSVIGRARRMGLSAKGAKRQIKAEADIEKEPIIKRNKTGIGSVVQAINRSKRKPDRPPTKPEKFRPRAADVVSLRRTILEVREFTECHWPDDDRNPDGVHTFCGNPTLDGQSYCECHREINRGDGTTSERAAIRNAKSIARAA